MTDPPPIRTSIIVPAYNYERYVARTLESALAQDDSGIEIVVVDDGSEDGTAEAVRPFVERGVRYIQKANGGLPAARNTGIAEARGKYLVFLDADDLLESHAVRTFREAMESRPEAFGIVACGYRTIDVDDRPIEDKSQGADGRLSEVSLADIVVRTRFCTTVMAKADAIRAAGLFDEKLRASEDRDMWIRVAAAGYRIALLPDVLVLVRRHGTNMSADPVRQMTAVRQVLRKAWRQRTAPRWNLPLWGRAWAIYHHQGSSMYWDRRQRWPAWRHLLLSFVCWPVFVAPAWNGQKPFFRLRRVGAWLRRFGREWKT